MFDSFSARMRAAIAKEKRDTATLEMYGCKVFSFGQAQLPEEFRAYLLESPRPLLVRWLPDLLVVQPAVAPVQFWLVDSKTGRDDTANWVLEKKAHEAHRLQQPALSLPIVYIWPDGCSCNYVDDLTDDVLSPGFFHGNGSGTRFWLVPKKITRSLKDVFSSAKSLLTER